MRPRLVVGNWKMHGSLEFVGQFVSDLLARADELTGLPPAEVAREDSDAEAANGAGGAGKGSVEVVLCPTHVHLQAAGQALAGSSVKLGAQDAFHAQNGAYTGEVAAAMLSELGVHYVIVGHSERRQLFGEDDAMVANKFASVREAGMTPILCVGETLEEREEGRTEAVVLRQLDAVMSAAGAGNLGSAVIAYEPVWAIGTGKTATPEQAQQIHALLREHIAQKDRKAANQVRILYGGSVKAENAAELFAQADIDGGLVGGASLNTDQFIAICKLAD